MSPPPVLLDANVPMYAAGREHPYKEPCLWLMEEIARGRLEAAIDVELIQEVLHRYGSLRQFDLGIQLATELLLAVPDVYPVTAADARLTVELFKRYAARGLAARDLVHAAVMNGHGLTHIISTDKRFDRIEGITRLDPLALYASRQ